MDLALESSSVDTESTLVEQLEIADEHALFGQVPREGRHRAGLDPAHVGVMAAGGDIGLAPRRGMDDAGGRASAPPERLGSTRGKRWRGRAAGR